MLLTLDASDWLLVAPALIPLLLIDIRCHRCPASPQADDFVFSVTG